MSDVIVARLRRENDCLLTTGLDVSDVLLPAAAEIERLRARVAVLKRALHGIAKFCDKEEKRTLAIIAIANTARAALEAKP